jgi:hypothetical protein
LVPRFHLCVAFGALGIQLWGQMLVEQRDEHLSKVTTASHPLQVMPAVVMVGPVKLATRKGPLDPVEEGRVPYVHSQGDLRLATVSAEVAFSD